MLDHHRPKSQRLNRQRLASTLTASRSTIALAVVVASLVALLAGTGTALAHPHHGAIEHSHGASLQPPDVAIQRTDGGSTQRGQGGRDSSAVAVNTTDHSLAFELTFAILTVTGNVVDNLNLADAHASCNQCQTVAISIQTLLVDSAASTVAPINIASARNQNCVQCDTVAIAYQFVVAAGTKLEFTRQGRREVAYIRRQLEMLRRQARGPGMTGDQIVAAVAALMKQYAGILNTELVPASQAGARGDSAGASGATLPAGVTTSTGPQPPAQAQQATSQTANQGVSTTTSTPSSPTSTTTPAATSGATAGATTPSGATTTSSSTPTTTTTGTTSTSAGPTVTTTTPSGATTTPSGATTTTSGATTTTSGATTTTSGATTTTSSSTPTTTTP